MVGGLFNMKEREVSGLVRYEWISDRYSGLQYVNKLFDTCPVKQWELISNPLCFVLSESLLKNRVELLRQYSA